tara:strand:- start:456 stop:668 length:213 start_codon:yes stop_codon:yes gene_type:complete
MIILSYLGIGFFLMFVLEVLIYAYANHIEFIGEEVPEFNNFERIICSVIWPITLAVILKSVIDQLKNLLK